MLPGSRHSIPALMMRRRVLNNLLNTIQKDSSPVIYQTEELSHFIQIQNYSAKRSMPFFIGPACSMDAIVCPMQVNPSTVPKFFPAGICGP